MSNNHTIEQMNEVISLFDGWELIEEDNAQHFKRNGCFYTHSQLLYHSSWDWLMPVVRKIYDILAEMLKKRPPHTACHGDMIEVDIHCAIREVDILKTHDFVHQFIQWYNKQKEVTNG